MANQTPAGSASVHPEDPDPSRCWCCGHTYPEGELTRLGDHPEVGICTDCALFLRRRARAAHAGQITRHLHATANRIREVVMSQHLNERPAIGPALRWLNRRVPW